MPATATAASKDVPWYWFVAALLGLGAAFALLPRSAHGPLAATLILGGLLAANRHADAAGIQRPLAGLYPKVGG